MKVWIIYDGRAEVGDTDDSSVLECCSSWRDLKAALHTWRDHDAVLYEYDRVGAAVDNEQFIGHLRQGRQSLLALCTHENPQHATKQGDGNASHAGT